MTTSDFVGTSSLQKEEKVVCCHKWFSGNGNQFSTVFTPDVTLQRSLVHLRQKQSGVYL